mmetsp:Transcript_49572/g.91441  ORF Transcript_49572/g.91441 Transcript_49572/m.91441 type:complete len:183 (-) Transcript_49572:125-673(-)
MGCFSAYTVDHGAALSIPPARGGSRPLHFSTSFDDPVSDALDSQSKIASKDNAELLKAATAASSQTPAHHGGPMKLKCPCKIDKFDSNFSEVAGVDAGMRTKRAMRNMPVLVCRCQEDTDFVDDLPGELPLPTGELPGEGELPLPTDQIKLQGFAGIILIAPARVSRHAGRRMWQRDIAGFL